MPTRSWTFTLSFRKLTKNNFCFIWLIRTQFQLNRKASKTYQKWDSDTEGWLKKTKLLHMSFVWAFFVPFKALLHSHAAHSFYWILKPLPSAKRFYFGVSSYVGGWFPPSLHASFIAIFRTRSLLETFLSPFYDTVSSFRAASSCSQGQRRKQELKLSLSCLADANSFCLKHRSPVHGVQGCRDSSSMFLGWVFLGIVLCKGHVQPPCALAAVASEKGCCNL